MDVFIVHKYNIIFSPIKKKVKKYKPDSRVSLIHTVHLRNKGSPKTTFVKTLWFSFNVPRN